jgi:hypothetical protein
MTFLVSVLYTKSLAFAAFRVKKVEKGKSNTIFFERYGFFCRISPPFLLDNDPSLLPLAVLSSIPSPLTRDGHLCPSQGED